MNKITVRGSETRMDVAMAKSIILFVTIEADISKLGQDQRLELNVQKYQYRDFTKTTRLKSESSDCVGTVWVWTRIERTTQQDILHEQEWSP